jgi:hypothetical protein
VAQISSGLNEFTAMQSGQVTGAGDPMKRSRVD